jgi:uncharacterized membrane protein HdeD (DUF308 family)
MAGRRHHDGLALDDGDSPMTSKSRRPEAPRRLLRRLYLFRVALAVAWVASVSELASLVAPHAPRSGTVAVVLAAYPALDGLATLADLRVVSGSSWQRLLCCNLVAGLMAAASILWLAGNLSAEIRAFGVWAIASGGIQLVLGAIRQRSLNGQWLMIISGGGSVAAGITFAGLAGPATPGLPALVQYSLGGAVWYLLTAGWLFLPRSRRREALPASERQDWPAGYTGQP